MATFVSRFFSPLAEGLFVRSARVAYAAHGGELEERGRQNMTEALQRTAAADGAVVFTVRVPAEKADAAEAALKALLALAGAAPQGSSSAEAALEPQEAPGVLLKRMRRSRRMTQKALAAVAGASQARISDWESGVRTIPADAAQAFSKLFELPITAFLR